MCPSLRRTGCPGSPHEPSRLGPGSSPPSAARRRWRAHAAARASPRPGSPPSSPSARVPRAGPHGARARRAHAVRRRRRGLGARAATARRRLDRGATWSASRGQRATRRAASPPPPPRPSLRAPVAPDGGDDGADLRLAPHGRVAPPRRRAAARAAGAPRAARPSRRGGHPTRPADIELGVDAEPRAIPPFDRNSAVTRR